MVLLCSSSFSLTLPLDELISARLPLERINEGFETMKGDGVGRSIVIFPGVF